MRDLLSVPAMRPPGSPRTGVPGRLHREAAGERPPRARPQRRGSPGPIPNPAVKPAFAESTAAQGCGRAGRRARGGRFSMLARFRARGDVRRRAACAGRGPQGGCPLRPFRVLGRSRLRWRPDRRCGAYGPRPASWGEQVPQGDRPLWVFLYSEAVRCRRICARTSCWTGPVHGMCWRICVGSLRAF